MEKPVYELFCNTNKDDLTPVFGIYYHGTLEEDLGYDVVSVKKDSPFLKIFAGMIDNPYAQYISDMTPVSINGKHEIVAMYFWYSEKLGIPRGFIMRADDNEGCEYVLEKFNDRADVC